jgi:uncharacterized protein YdhG (YjbR/CyaY superfamily)
MMKAKAGKPTNIDEYIAEFPPDARERLQKVRGAIRKAAPKAEETIKYLLPTYVLAGMHLTIDFDPVVAHFR